MISHSYDRSGLTLLELMVVLIILAIVATVAIRTLEPQVNSERIQSANRLLEEIRDAAIGQPQRFQLDGTPMTSGLMADVGCIPFSSANLSQELPEETKTQFFPELWDINCRLALDFPYQFRAGPARPTDYTNVRIPCGWRGPYLRLPVGSTNLTDPWGRTPRMIPDSDGLAGQIEIDIPPEVASIGEPLSVDLSVGKVNVTGTVLLDDSSAGKVVAALLLPDPQTSLTTLAVRADEDQENSTFTFTRVPIGFRAIAVDFANRQQVKYVQVTHQGANVVFDFRTPTTR